jgi:hypothetical protein
MSGNCCGADLKCYGIFKSFKRLLKSVVTVNGSMFVATIMSGFTSSALVLKTGSFFVIH